MGYGGGGVGSILALKLLWTRVSSRSRTRHFLPTCSGEMGGKSGFGTPSYTEMRRWREGRKKEYEQGR